MLQGLYIPLSTSTPIRVQPANQPTADSAQEDSPYQQVIPGIPPHSYPSLAALRTGSGLTIAPPISFSRRIINDIEEQKRKALKGTVEGIVRLNNTSPILEVDEEIDYTPVQGVTQQQRTVQADTQEETLQPESSLPEDTSVKKTMGKMQDP